VHVVVTANSAPKTVRDQLKAWCTKNLKEDFRERGIPVRMKWWTRGGSRRFIADKESLEAVIRYVLEGQ